MKKRFNRNKKKKPVSARSGSHTNRSGSFPKQAEKSRPKIPLTELPTPFFPAGSSPALLSCSLPFCFFLFHLLIPTAAPLRSLFRPKNR